MPIAALVSRLVDRHGIRDVCPVDSSEWRQRMRPHAGIAGNFERLDAPGHECISNQRPMATPRDCFRAHHRYALRARQRHAPFELLSEGWGLHVVGIAAKALVAPAEIN